jgi:PKD repeat protein
LIAAAVGFAPAVSAPVNISISPGWASWAPRAVFDGSGNLYVVWVELYSSQNGDLFFSKYTKSAKTWSTPVNLSNSGRVWSTTYEVSGIDSDDAGQVHVVWTEQSAIRLRTLAGGSWGGVEQIGSGSALEGAKIGASGTGDLYICWWGNDGVVISRARVGGAWEGARAISDGSRRSKLPDISVGNGSAMAAWVEKSGDLYQAAYVLRSKGYGAGWSSPARVSPQSNSQQHASVEFLNGETPQIVFTPVIEPNRYVAHSAWSGSGFGTAQRISSEQMLHYPSLAERSGVLLAVWQVGSFGSGQAVYYNGYANGKWGGETAVSGSNGCTFCDAAIDPTGIVAIVWDASGEIMVEMSSGGVTPPIPNIAPVALFSMTPATGSAPLAVSFDAGASYDPDGTIAAYNWSFGDGQTATGKIIGHTFSTPGIYSVTLTVIDNLGKPGSKTQILEVVNLPPVPAFTITPPSGIVPVPITFDAASSSDPDGTVVLYDWTFSDGDSAQGKKITRVFSAPGVYAVKLTVTDNFGKTANLVKTFELLGLKPPLNLRWESFTDVSLFMTRVVTDVRWEANPANEAVAAIAKYRIYRRPVNDPASGFQFCGETDGTAVFWRDTKVQTANQHVYAVTARDAEGHESPLAASASIARDRGVRGSGRVSLPTRPARIKR